MNPNQKLLGYYNYTVLLTYIGMLSGFMGIAFAFDGITDRSIICLMVAGFCDMFDGKVASTRDRTVQEKQFGIQIDSLSDLICFGVLPAILTYTMNRDNFFIPGIASLYVLCALIRLAYFNVDEQERQANSSDSRTIYYGLPVTLSALIIPVVYSLAIISPRTAHMGMPLALLLMAILFLLPFKIKKPRLIGKICLVICGILELALVILSLGDV